MKYAIRAALVLALFTFVPIARACVDAGGPLAPGDYIQIADHSCSLAFVLVDENGIYFATAGHCVKVDQKVVDINNKLVGAGAFHYLVPENGNEQDGSPGQDFALIRVDPANYDHITPAVCGWGGPQGIYEEKPGSGDVHHYGHGVAVGDVAATRARTGTNLQNDNVAFSWLGDAVPGDSGSAVLSADGRALGVLTHLQAGVGTTNGGTHIDRGMALAAEKGFPHLRLVLGNEDPVALYHAMQANATLTNASARPPTTGAPTGSNASTNASQPSNGTSPSATTPPATGRGDTETPGAVAGPRDAAKKTPGPEFVLVLATLGALAFRRPKTLK